MPICSKCGVEHELLDPAFARPDAYAKLDERTSREHANASDDLCSIAIPGSPLRYFIRGTLAVDVEDYPDGIHWGFWAEVAAAAFDRVVETWDDVDQSAEPPFAGRLANTVPTYPSTLGLPLIVRLRGPTTRPSFEFAPQAEHPFVHECRAGVPMHRAHEWNRLCGS